MPPQPSLQLPWVSWHPSRAIKVLLLSLLAEGAEGIVSPMSPHQGLCTPGAQSWGWGCNRTARTGPGSGSSPICSQKPSFPELSS